MTFAILSSLILFSLLFSCTVADVQLQGPKLRSLLSNTHTYTTIHAHNLVPSDSNFKYRISYQDYNSNEYAIYSPPSYINEQQWFHGANLLNEIKTRTDNTFSINVANYCLYHSPLIKTVRPYKRFFWFDCTYNPSQTLEKRIATHYYRHQESSEFRVFFSFENPQSTSDHVPIYDKITLSIKTSATSNQESVTQIPIYCVTKKIDMKIDGTTSPLTLFPWELRSQEDIDQGKYLWKYQIMFDKSINQTAADENILKSNHLLFPVTFSMQCLSTLHLYELYIISRCQRIF